MTSLVSGRRIKTVLWCWIAAGGALSVLAGTDEFRVTPYVQNPATNAITVMWFSTTASPGVIAYAPKGGPTATVHSTPVLATNLDYHVSEHDEFPDGVPPSTPYQHQVRLTDLTSGTAYGYRVTQGESVYLNRFKTAPPADHPIRFIVYSDSETEPESTGKKDEQWTDPVSGRNRTYFIDQTTGYASNLVIMAQRKPDFLLIAGDLAESGGEQRDWDEFWRHNAGSYNDIAGRTPILAVLGNHCYYGGPERGDYGQPGSEAAVRKWLTYFDNPINGAGTADQQERFYRLDYGPVAVIVLDTCNGDDTDPQKDTSAGPDRLNTATGCQAPDFNPGSAQYQWLERQLADAQANRRFTFVSFHQVPYSVGYHGRSFPGDNQSGVPTRVLTDLFLRYGVDALLCGHDEMYEHSQVTGTEVRPDGTTRPHTLHVYDIGIGGDGLRGMFKTDNPYETFRAHANAPEEYDASGILTNGGKHYGHLEINVGTNAQGAWQATLTPVYVFVSTNAAGVAQGFDRRTYDDEETLTEGAP